MLICKVSLENGNMESNIFQIYQKNTDLELKTRVLSDTV